MRDRLIYSLCDFTGAWCKPYRDAGYRVVQVDLKHGEDVRLLRVPSESVYGVLAAPPCTAFAGSGAQWWKGKDESGETLEGLSIVDACIRFITAVQPEFWVLENPVGRLKYWLGSPRMMFHPYEYGGYLGEESEGYSKKTLLWGNFNIPEKKPIPNKYGSKLWKNYGGKSDRTKEMRSITPAGFSRAFYEANK